MDRLYPIHTIFDILAVIAALTSGYLVFRWKFEKDLKKTASMVGPGYFLCLSLGSILGAYIFGTMNLYLSDTLGIGRSILGSLFGATFTVELYKLSKGITRSTGYLYIVPFCACVIIGRLGCLLSGMADQTFGVPTSLPWGWDFGDHVYRHPVALYESLSMLFLLGAILFGLTKFPQSIVRYGYYICVAFYATQRFVWEFLKPYGSVAGPFNLFQVLCILLFIYSITMILKVTHEDRTA